MYAEKDFKIRVSPAILALAFEASVRAVQGSAFIRVLFALKNELTRETLISG